jgi:hypothetical protein
MILEALVTTRGADGRPHLAPMGPSVSGIDFTEFELRPFPSSQTYQNLLIHPIGVLHVTDDALLIARAAIGAWTTHDANEINDELVLRHCHRYYQFRVTNVNAAEPRIRMTCEVMGYGQGTRPWFGFNRGRHAVLEAAILATRVHLLPKEQIEAEFQLLQRIVDKTGGPDEQEAMALMTDHVRGQR